ncbi:hypothetical protein VTK73DRAFT_8377 [Phialemonium thermophilum]|uniref:Uncharacterized protein n=1 Tax=Phialemonium thermophilum TaxID=223376 RepID=A0ABR3XQ40_9PEZI
MGLDDACLDLVSFVSCLQDPDSESIGQQRGPSLNTVLGPFRGSESSGNPDGASSSDPSHHQGSACIWTQGSLV